MNTRSLSEVLGFILKYILNGLVTDELVISPQSPLKVEASL